MFQRRQQQSTESYNFGYLVLDIAWFGVALAATSRFLALFAIRLGASPAELSLIASLPGLLLIISTGFSGWWRQRHSGTIQALFWPSFGFRLIFLLPVFAPFFPMEFRPVWLILAATLPALPQGISGGIFVVMMREAISGERFNKLLSQRAVAMNITIAAGALAFGALLEFVIFPLNYQVMFGVAWVASLVSLWYVARIKVLFPEPLPEPEEDPHKESIWKDKAFQSVAFVGFITHAAFFAAIMVTPLYLVEAFDASEGYIATFGFVELIGGVIAGLFTDRLIKRIGTKSVLTLAMFGIGTALFVIALAPNLAWVLGAAMLTGVAWTMVSIGIYAYFAEKTGMDGATQASVGLQQMIALGIFVGPLLGGVLIELNIGLVNVLIMGVLIRFIGGVLIHANPFERRALHVPMSSLKAAYRRSRSR